MTCMSKVQDSKKVALSKYADSIRERAGEDKYLLAMADRIEQGGNTLAGSIDLAVQTRLDVLGIEERETQIATAKVADTVNNSAEIQKLAEAVNELNNRLNVLYTTFVTVADALAWNVGISGDMLDRMNKTRDQMLKTKEEESQVPDIEENESPVEELPVEETTEPEVTPESVPEELPDGIEEFKPDE